VTVLLHPYMPTSTSKLLAALGRPDVAYAGASLGASGWGGEVVKLEQLFPKQQ
jgi:methionyl-tRNA synthetase